jgi:hypothetical protein
MKTATGTTRRRRSGAALLGHGLLLLALSAPAAAQHSFARQPEGNAAARGLRGQPGATDRAGAEAGPKGVDSRTMQRNTRRPPVTTRSTGCTRAFGQGLDKCPD